MAHFLPPEHVRQVNKLEWPNTVGALSVYNYGQVKVVSYSGDSCGVFETCLPPGKECLYLSSLFLSLCARFGSAIQACQLS